MTNRRVAKQNVWDVFPQAFMGAPLGLRQIDRSGHMSLLVILSFPHIDDVQILAGIEGLVQFDRTSAVTGFAREVFLRSAVIRHLYNVHLISPFTDDLPAKKRSTRTST